MEKIKVSTVTPVFAGEAHLEQLFRELDILRTKWDREHMPLALMESIFVDDGSADASSRILDGLASRYEWVRVIRLSRNFGQHPATIAGILHSSGDWVVTLDEDLQHPPAEIPSLLRRAVSKGADVVYANPTGSVHSGFMRDFGARFYKGLVARVAGNPKIAQFNSFRLIRGSIARAAASVCAYETYLDVALSWFTERIEALELPLKDHRFASQEKSGYTARRLLSHARRLIVSAQTKALRGGALLGACAMAASILYGAYIIALKLIAPDAIAIKGWASLFAAILFFGGTISFLIGIGLEYLSIILGHTHGRPVFFVVDRSSDTILARYWNM